MISAAQLYLDLANASDHLPVVADYTIPIPAPIITEISTAGTNLVLNVANNINGGHITVLTSADLAVPMDRWTALTTNVVDAGSVTLTLSNIVNQAVTVEFFTLKEN